jgi:hypothetical protein
MTFFFITHLLEGRNIVVRRRYDDYERKDGVLEKYIALKG